MDGVSGMPTGNEDSGGAGTSKGELARVDTRHVVVAPHDKIIEAVQ